MFAARLRAYAPGGASLGLLPEPMSWEAAVVHGDLGALSVTYSTLAAGGPLIRRALTDGLEVAVEVWDGETWVEPRGARFLRTVGGKDAADDTETNTITFKAWAWLLGKARILEGTFTEGRRAFTAPTAGGIMSALMGENASRDGIPVPVVGSATVDAAGAAWPSLQDQGFDYGTDYLAVLSGLQQANTLDWATQARGLYLWLPDSAAAYPDLSESVILRLGREVAQAPDEETIEQLIGRIGVRAQAGGTVMVEESSAPSPWGVWEGFLSVGQVANETAATAMGHAELERTGRQLEQFTRDLILHDGAPVPLVDYWPGVWITAPTTGPGETARVQQVTLTYGPEGYGGNVVLNDRLVEGDIRRARALAILSGSGKVGSGGAPAPIAVDPEASRIPKTPTSLDATASLVFDPVTGAPSGVVDVTWDAVTEATDDGPLTISGYELQHRVGAEDWQTVTTPQLSARLTGFTPGDEVDTRVRAVGARTTLPSAWSGIYSVTVPGDVTAPDIPSVPVVTSRLGVVTVAWDGLSDTGGAMPDDFARLEVAMGETPDPTDVVGTLLRAGELPVRRPYESTQYVQTRTVDTSGNASAWVPAVEPVMVHAVSGSDIEARSVSTNHLEVGSVDGEILAGELLLGSTIKTAESGQRVELSADGFAMFNGSEELLVSFPTDPDESPEIRGVVQADGLTVREGATFFSPLNSFAKDSTISLDESLSAPVTAPGATVYWGSLQLEQVEYSGSHGTFALIPSEIVAVGWHHGLDCLLVVQRHGVQKCRVWYYEVDGSLAPLSPAPLWDLAEGWDITSISTGTDGEIRMLFQFENDRYWIYDATRPSGSQTREYQRQNTNRTPILTMDGNNIWVVETFAAGPRFYRVTTGTSPVTIAEMITSTGAPSGLTDSPNTFYRDTADFGTTRMVVGYPGSGQYRVYSSTGAYVAAEDWPAPTSKVGIVFANPPGLFFTLGTDGRLWSHSALTWTSSTLDTWHFGQTFYDANTTGGTHETALGAVRTFTMKKRAFVRFTLVEVPFAGGSDDPNRWRLYGMRGAYSAGSMRLQTDGPYTQLTVTLASAPTTSGSVAPTTSTFPGGNPARLVSARTLPSNPLQSVIELRGDGSAVLGPIRVSAAGVLTFASDYDTGWLDCTVSSGTTNSQTMQARQVGPVVYINGRLSRTSSAADQLWFTLPTAIAPPRRITTLTPGSNAPDPAFVVVQGDRTVRTPVAMAGSYSLHLTTEYVV